MEVFAKIAEQIIKEQENILGPVALEQAKKVHGLKIDWNKHEIFFEGSKTDIVEKLIEAYRDLFGQVSVELCREATKNLIPQIPKNELPPLLQ